MNELIAKLLRPVSTQAPCGPDLSNDPRFDELQTILKGKPEVDVGSIKKPAEPPDWRELQTKSEKFLLGEKDIPGSKDLRVVLMLCCSLLKTSGLPGFRDGVQLIRGLLEQYWPTLYPVLDPLDNNDPTQRLNILSALTMPLGSPVISGWLTILGHLRTAPICQPKGGPPVTFQQIQAAKQKLPVGEGAAAAVPDLTKLAAIIREAGIEQATTQHRSVGEALEAVRDIDQFLTTTLGSSKTISFSELEQTLQQLLAELQPYLAGTAGETGAAGSGAGSQASGANGAADTEVGGITVRGAIRSRDQVVQAIDSICEYYKQVEPSSPVPYLLRRAQKLARMDFVEAMQELKLATVDSLRPSMGSAVETEEDKQGG
jgi:type VI secretion system protein ImpA